METRIGFSGWRYPPWRKTFYPNKLAQARELEYASRQVNSIEINGTFYSLQAPTSYMRWFSETPDDFKFSLKGSRFITHIRRLKDVQMPISNFYASGMLHLEQKLGPFLWQFAPSFRFEEERLEAFFEMLPRTFADAVRIAKDADRVEPSFPDSARNSKQKIRHAIEIRHDSFMNPDFIDLLHKHNIALVFADTAGKWPYMEDLTSDFVYMRLHGEAALYKSGYDQAALDFWAARIRQWRNGKQVANPLDMSDHSPAKGKKDIFCYFDNDVKVYAPFDAQKLMKMVGNASEL